MPIDQRRAFPSPNEFDLGMSLREYAAIHILAGLLAHPDVDPEHHHDVVNDAVTLTNDLFTRLGDPEWKRE